MKHKHKKPTRAQREAQSEAPQGTGTRIQLHRCSQCGYKGTKYAVKAHKAVCYG